MEGNGSKRGLLSKEFQVACAIYELTEEKKEKAWYNKLEPMMRSLMAGSTLSRTLKYLESWGIIKAQYGETETGRAGKLFYLSNEDKETIEMLFTRYWKS